MRKLLIANRGEIACRIIETARDMGIATVAVFSEADRHAPHVKMADQAVFIGPSEATQSYLNINVLIEACRKAGADAVHPGYGFLSERADFAEACWQAGITFVGPTAEAIAVMGDKAGAKVRMMEAGVPCAPGYLGENQDDSFLISQAKSLGAPLLVKAIAGGGGRGMRLVTEIADIGEAIISARREAEKAFGNGDLMLERLIEKGRHIEVQVFGDTHGNVVHLGERDCTAQRRRQKVIEEAPSPIVDEAMREQLGRDAVAAAKAVDYQGAGTVEFIVDQDMNHYFLEMNTRLQVEHPVTEMIAGVDLVEWQLRVARGESLPLSQDEICLEGHAIELRLYAEDPYHGFAPQTSTVLRFEANGDHVDQRIDSGIETGSRITPHYDPMVAKLIGYGTTREEATAKVLSMLKDRPLFGIKTNATFLNDLVSTAEFQNAEMDTGMLDRWQEDEAAIYKKPSPAPATWALAAALFSFPRKPGFGLRPKSVSIRSMEITCDDVTRKVVIDAGMDSVSVTLEDETITIEGLSASENTVSFSLDGVTSTLKVVMDRSKIHLTEGASVFVFSEVSPLNEKAEADDPSMILAPIAGSLASLAVGLGDKVHPDMQLATIEAMKMETVLKAKAAGTVRAINCEVGTSVEAGKVLLELDLDPDQTEGE